MKIVKMKTQFPEPCHIFLTNNKWKLKQTFNESWPMKVETETVVNGYSCNEECCTFCCPHLFLFLAKEGETISETGRNN